MVYNLGAGLKGLFRTGWARDLGRTSAASRRKKLSPSRGIPGGVTIKLRFETLPAILRTTSRYLTNRILRVSYFRHCVGVRYMVFIGMEN